MRTKTLLAAAAIIAAGVASSQAQSNVYSLNVVGYVNVTLRPGYNLITPQLKDASSSTEINVLLTNAPALADNSTFFGWNSGAQTFTDASIWVAAAPDTGWYVSDFSALSTDTATRGRSYFVFNAGAQATMTLVGEVPQGPNTITVPNNYGFLADFVPVAQEIATNGFPIADNATVFKWDAVTQGYTDALIGVAAPPDGPAWYLSDFSAQAAFVPSVAEGFVHFTTAGSATWNRNFTVQ